MRPSWLTPVFVLTVAAPTLLSALYFGFIASDVYVSESRFVLRTPERQSASGLVGALLQGSGFTRAQDDAFTIQDYIESRDALRLLNADSAVQRAYAADSVDVFNRFGAFGGDFSFEALHSYYRRKIVVAAHDAASSITTLQVRAPSSEQAQKINEQLLALSEGLVNRLNERARLDLIRFAQHEVDEAQQKAKAAALALSTYRSDKQVLDPERQAALQIQQVLKLQDELIATRTQLAQLRAFTPANPQIPSLEKRLEVLQKESDSETGRAVGGGDRSLSRKAADYQRLMLDNQFAEKQLASVLGALEQARSQAQRQQLYLERIVQPKPAGRCRRAATPAQRAGHLPDRPGRVGRAEHAGGWRSRAPRLTCRPTTPACGAR